MGADFVSFLRIKALWNSVNKVVNSNHPIPICAIRACKMSSGRLLRFTHHISDFNRLHCFSSVISWSSSHSTCVKSMVQNPWKHNKICILCCTNALHKTRSVAMSPRFWVVSRLFLVFISIYIYSALYPGLYIPLSLQLFLGSLPSLYWHRELSGSLSCFVHCSSTSAGLHLHFICWCISKTNSAGLRDQSRMAIWPNLQSSWDKFAVFFLTKEFLF